MNILKDYEEIRKYFKKDPYEVSFHIVRKEFANLSIKTKKDIISTCSRFLCISEISFKKNEKIRVASVKILVAAFPYSTKNIEALLVKDLSRYQYEVLFTLFCFVDRLQSMPGSKQL